MPRFQIPDEWLPVPWSDDDKETGHRCHDIEPVIEAQYAVSCGRRDGHDGVHIGARKPPGQDRASYWMWW
jgi:hypothetical protein